MVTTIAKGIKEKLTYIPVYPLKNQSIAKIRPIFSDTSR
ncbi:hypothetical protein M987_00032 [Enterobacter soli ATCC BAA-2102]|nr:hypothetical protein M987_00032 [Enterobacter soli ATCC BAA-2102]